MVTDELLREVLVVTVGVVGGGVVLLVMVLVCDELSLVVFRVVTMVIVEGSLEGGSGVLDDVALLRVYGIMNVIK